MMMMIDGDDDDDNHFKTKQMGSCLVLKPLEKAGKCLTGPMFHVLLTKKAKKSKAWCVCVCGGGQVGGVLSQRREAGKDRGAGELQRLGTLLTSVPQNCDNGTYLMSYCHRTTI